jgi:PBP1b-binding outer membrane lipoprotein LpoB
MRRTVSFVLLLTAAVLWAGCTTTDNSNTAGNANMAATPANANTGMANTNNANANIHGNMNMSNMNMIKPNKKANPNKTP